MQPASTKRSEPAVETIQVFTIHEVTGKYLAVLEVISSLYILQSSYRDECLVRRGHILKHYGQCWRYGL